MPAPLTDATRDAVRAGLRAGKSHRVVAAETGVSVGMVGKIKRAMVAAGEADPSDRSQTEAATRARAADNAARRAAIESRLLEVAAAELETWNSPVTWGNFGGRDNDYNSVELDQRTDAMKASLSATIQRLVKTAADLASVTVDPTEQAKSSVRELVEGLREQERAA